VSATVVWREIRPLAAELFRCDFPDCGEQADTIHFVPWCDCSCERALFACERHDPGGYHFAVDDFLDDRIDWREHLLDKLSPAEQRHAVGGWFELAGRIEAITACVVHADEPAGAPPAEPEPEKPTPEPRRARWSSPRQLAPGEAMTRYGQVALAGLVDEMRAAAEHTRNITLNRIAFRAGQLVASGQIAEDVAATEIEAAAIEAGLKAREVRSTFASGFKAGLKEPARTDDGDRP
jgi:hypothetical protein